MFNEKTHHLCKLSLLANFFGKKVTNQALDRYSKRPEVTISATLRKKKSEEVKSVSHSFVTPWTVARQALLSMGLSRQENWSG